MYRFFPTLLFTLSISLLWAQTEPTANPASGSASNVKAFRVFLQFDNAGSDGYLVLMDDQAITTEPTDNTIYEVGEGLDGSKVVYNGSYRPTVLIDALVAEKTYFFKVFAFNGSGTSTDYRQADPLAISVETTCKEPGDYYDNIDASSANFIANLTSLINVHRQRDYGDYDDLMMVNVYERDTVNNEVAINCDYTGELVTYESPITFSNSFYTREHMMPRSWMPAGGDVSQIPGSDYHNLAVTNHSEANEVRLNHPYGEVTNTVEAYLEGKAGFDANGNYVYEPKDDFKGDAARALFYMMICYDGTGGNWAIQDLQSNGNDQLQSVLKDWHAQDPPDAFEIARHEYIAFIQGNRNPFIDHPEWADCINFFNLTKTGTCTTLDVECETHTSLRRQQTVVDDLTLFPNPSSGAFTASWASPLSAAGTYTVFNSLGQQVTNGKVWTGQNDISLSLPHAPKGVYYLHIEAGTERRTASLLLK